MRIANAVVLGAMMMTFGLVLSGASIARGQDGPIDMEKARRLQRRFKAGEPFTQEQQEYLNRAGKLRRARGGRDSKP